MNKINNITERTNELDETSLHQDDKVVKLELITGGKGPPSDYWVKDLTIGTVFLARHKQVSAQAIKDFVLGEFAVYNKTEKAMLLLVNEGHTPRPVWVDPMKFSNQMEMVEVVKTNAFLEVLDDPDQEEISDDGNRAV